jgi:hypothetical protein
LRTPLGSGIQVYGNATNAQYDVVVDGQNLTDYAPSASSNVLAAVSGLHQGKHSLALSVRGAASDDRSCFVAFEKLVLASDASSSVN